jgi:hypothetical protein
VIAPRRINHPHLDATSITTTDVIARNLLKLLMAALALAGLTGMYLRQVTKIGFLGLLGYVLFAAGYLSIFGTEFVAAFILPTLAHSAPAYVNDVIAAANNDTATGDIGLMQTVILVTGTAYPAGAFIFGIALFRANVLAAGLQHSWLLARWQPSQPASCRSTKGCSPFPLASP